VTALIGGESGTYWIQVGAFRDEATAQRVAAELRQRNFRVEESASRTSTPRATAPPAPVPVAPDRYAVLVVGATKADVDTRLAGKSLTTAAVEGGVALAPSLPLREAVDLARELSGAGLSVRVRRQPSGEASRPAPAAGAPAAGPEAGPEAGPVYRVRVGAFADRAAAQAALHELESLGYRPFLAGSGGQ
jgi:hypothetical protein